MTPRPPATAIVVEGFSDARDRLAIRRAMAGALEALRAHRIGVEVQAVSVRDSLRLNRLYRGRRRAGDVLSFPLPADEPGGSAGDVYLCPALVERGARRLGIAPRRWLGHLAIHGLLHLLGFDHRSAAESSRMDGLTRALRGAGR